MLFLNSFVLNMQITSFCFKNDNLFCYSGTLITEKQEMNYLNESNALW